MKILDQHFQRIVVISLPQCVDRANRAMSELRDKELSDRAEKVRAVDGRISKPPDWWPSGNGAWGCMQSHHRVVQDALLDGLESILIIEDDTIWQDGAAKMIEEFIQEIPDDWGQIYFGGQHRRNRQPKRIEGKFVAMKAQRIHRTHAYAIHKRAMVKFLQHIAHAPDYIEARTDPKNPKNRHVDHQLEVAHLRGDWKVYCPSFWVAGQGENSSNISGKINPDQWWHPNVGAINRYLPIVISDRKPTKLEMLSLHFGKNISPSDHTIDVGVKDLMLSSQISGVFEIISREAFEHQLLPAVHPWESHISALTESWPGGVIRLSDIDNLSEEKKSIVDGLRKELWRDGGASYADK